MFKIKRVYAAFKAIPQADLTFSIIKLKRKIRGCKMPGERKKLMRIKNDLEKLYKMT